MTNETGIQRAEPILETYDPQWEARFDRINDELSEAQTAARTAYQTDRPEEAAKYNRLSEGLIQQLHAAHQAQFRTASEYKQWHGNHLAEKATRERKILILGDLPPNASAAAISDWAASSYEVLAEQDFRRLPVGQPDGLTGFAKEQPANTKRTTFHALFDEGEARCTIEQTANSALVCFHHIPNAKGVSPTNYIEELATGTKQTFLPHIRPQNIDFFIHVPAAVGQRTFGEMFSRVDMQWSGNQYSKPEWTRFQQIPPAIHDAELAPYDEPPLPAQSESSRPKDLRQSVLALLSRKAKPK